MNQEKNKKISTPLGITIISLLAIIVTFGAFKLYYLSLEEEIIKSKEVINGEILEFSEFNDTEVGISFKYPKSWGDVVLKNDFFTVMGSKNIYFTNQPKIIMEVVTYDNYPKKEARYLCDREILESGGGQQGAINVFRLNGIYKFGDCLANYPFLFSAVKKQKSNDSLASAEYQEPINSSIKISKRIFVELENPIYNYLTLKIEIDEYDTNEFCTFEDGRTRIECINYKEKEIIENILKEFQLGNLEKEIDFLLNSINLYSIDNVEERYLEYFKEKKVYENKDWGIRFTYPLVFEEPKVDEIYGDNLLMFNPNNRGRLFFLRKETLEDVINEEERIKKCIEQNEFCMFSGLRKKEWEKIKNILEENEVGEVFCPYERMCSFCEIIMLGEIKMLLNHSCFSEGGSYDRLYFYIEDTLFSWFNEPIILDLNNSETVFQEIYFKIFREILESIEKIEK